MRDQRLSITFRLVALGVAIAVASAMAYYALGGVTVGPVIIAACALIVGCYAWRAERRPSPRPRVDPEDQDRER